MMHQSGPAHAAMSVAGLCCIYGLIAILSISTVSSHETPHASTMRK